MKLYSNEIIQLLKGLNPNLLLLETKSTTLTVQLLLNKSQNLALQLLARGMKYNDKVIIASEMGIDFVVIMFATMMLKCKVAIIDPEMGRDNYNSKLKQFDPNWVFLDSRIAFLQEHPMLRHFYFAYKINGLYFTRKKSIKTIATGQWMPLILPHIKLQHLLSAKYNSPITFESTTSLPYLITYTSGTIVEPKGVLHTTHGLSKSIETIAELIKSDQPQIMATHLPHFMLIGACAGIGTKLWDINWSASDRYKFILKHNITTMFAPPVEYQALIDYCEKHSTLLPSSLMHLIIGSAPVHTSFLNRLIANLPNHTKITCLYGMTENLVVTVIDGRKKAIMQSNGDPLGYPVAGVQVKIGDDSEILIKSNQLFDRYWHLEARSEWHATGDLGYLDSSGVLVLLGRKKDMIIRKNFNLYPALYISTIQKIQGVIDAVFIGRYNEIIADEEVHLFVEAIPLLSKELLMSQLKSGPYSIDKEAWPDEIHFVKIPRKGRQFKIDINQLKASITI